MQPKALSTLEGMDSDELAAERQEADEKIQELRAYKKTIQDVEDGRDIKEKLKVFNLDNPAVAQALSQHITEVGGIESEEASGPDE